MAVRACTLFVKTFENKLTFSILIVPYFVPRDGRVQSILLRNAKHCRGFDDVVLRVSPIALPVCVSDKAALQYPLEFSSAR